MKIFITLIVILSFSFTENKSIQKKQSDILYVGYTYWWPFNGPFVQPCKQSYALAFEGEIVALEAPIHDSEMLYVSQVGRIKIENVLTHQDFDKRTFISQQYFQSDCFYELGLKVGDKVLVTCYEYENYYAIPGGKSILKIGEYNSLESKSIQHWINYRDTEKLAKDKAIWSKHNLLESWNYAINCK